MEKNKRRASYWHEVFTLFTKAGAFGIVTIFNHPEMKKTDTMKPKSGSLNQSSPLNKEDNSESVRKFAGIA